MPSDGREFDERGLTQRPHVPWPIIENSSNYVEWRMAHGATPVDLLASIKKEFPDPRWEIFILSQNMVIGRRFC